MNKDEIEYLNLLECILEEGRDKPDRTGTGTLSLVGQTLSFDLTDGFPLITSKKTLWRSVWAELRWFLNGQSSIRPLLEDGCNIWNSWAYKRAVRDKGFTGSMEEYVQEVLEAPYDEGCYLGDLGPIYGYQWRHTGVDQIAQAIETMINDPASRRILVDSWDVDHIADMELMPCHYSFQVVLAPCESPGWSGVDFEATLIVNQRSADMPVGVPFNIASYSALLHLMCSAASKRTGLVYEPNTVIWHGGDCHIYLDQIAGVRTLIDREPFSKPRIIVDHEKVTDDLKDLTEDVLTIEGYDSHPFIHFPVSV